MPKIEADVNQFSTEYTVLPDDKTYRVSVKKIEVAEDKNNNPYLKVQTEVLEPEEYRGKALYDPYLRIPTGNEKTPGDKEQIVKYARFISGFKVPKDSNGAVDTDDMLGCEGDVMIVNEEYKGKVGSKIKDYLVAA